MFVKLKPGVISHFPGQERCWCFRGDRFADTDQKQIRNLVNHFKAKMHLYAIVELYDNDHPRDSEERMILKYIDGVISDNSLVRYQDLLDRYPLPKFLRK